MVFWISWAILTPLMFVLFPTKIIGKKYVKRLKKEAVITSCNHQSNADAIILKTRVNTSYKLMAKDSLFKNKFIGWYMGKLGAYPVKRGQNDITAVKKTLGYLKNNKHLAIFQKEQE